jgi:starvation-inducible DNA-binding protein
MTQQERQEVVQSLQQLLADTVVFKQKVHAYHWNVTGPLFHELHELFQDVYEDLEDAIDEIGEQIRILDEYPQPALGDYVSQSVLEEAQNPPPSALEMVQELYEDNERVRNILRALQEAADRAEGQNEELATGEAVLDFAVERQREHDEFRYMLRSHIEASGNEPTTQ